MDSGVLNKHGFSLVEISLVMLITAVFIYASVCLTAKVRQGALAQRTIAELETIAAASTEYYSENGAWPADISGLRPGYINSQSGVLNPFGNVYTVTPDSSGITVSTVLPKGLVTAKSFGTQVVVTNQGNNDLVSITKPAKTGNWRLRYEKKYIYKK